jgi:hypothetical protein
LIVAIEENDLSEDTVLNVVAVLTDNDVTVEEAVAYVAIAEDEENSVSIDDISDLI